MILRTANYSDLQRVLHALAYKKLPFIKRGQEIEDFTYGRLYVVVDCDKVVGAVSLVYDPDYDYYAIKRMFILNNKNKGKGIARFALRKIQEYAMGPVGATPWVDNAPVRHLLETEGFTLQYIFNNVWCYYKKEDRK